MENEELHIEIDRYLKGKMNAEERLSFEIKKASNSEIESLFQEAKMIRSVLAEQRFQSLGQDLADGLKSRKASDRNRNFGIGGSVVLLTLLGVGTLMYEKQEGVQAVQIETKSNHDSVEAKGQKTNEVSGQALNLEIVSEENDKKRDAIIAQQPSIHQEQPSSTEKSDLPLEDIAIKETTPTKPLVAEKEIVKEVQKAAGSTVDCGKIKWEVNLTTEPSCLDKSNGKMHVAKVEGGVKPFNTRLFNVQKQEIELDGLSSGTYLFQVIDANQCTHETKVKIESKNCIKKIELLFQPEKDAELEIPLREPNGRWKLMNNAGAILYSNSFDSDSYIYKWDGNGINGTRIGNGVYLLDIEYGSGVKDIGYITIY